LKSRVTAAAVLAAIGALALVGLLAYGLITQDPDGKIEEATDRGERPGAPELTLPRLSGGGEESLADYDGQVVVLNFWASWCEPCIEESPLLERWHRRIEPDGGTVVGVDVLDVTDDAHEFVKRFDLTYPQLRDGDGDTLADFGVTGQPYTFVIDRRGRVAAVRRGPVDDDFMRAEVLPLLRERA
jgi:cytochrome c biogenesis protein CcmG/thiol:disulfide interchange protein DsbE